MDFDLFMERYGYDMLLLLSGLIIIGLFLGFFWSFSGFLLIGGPLGILAIVFLLIMYALDKSRRIRKMEEIQKMESKTRAKYSYNDRIDV